MAIDSLQNIDQAVVRIDIVQLARDDQALHDSDLTGAEFGSTEQPVLPAQRDGPQAALKVIGVERHIRIGEKH